MKEEEENVNNELITNLTANDCLISTIHSFLLHSTDNGYYLTQNEKNQIKKQLINTKNSNNNISDNVDYNFELQDNEAILINHLLKQRRNTYLDDLRHDIDNNKYNKFVTIIYDNIGMHR